MAVGVKVVHWAEAKGGGVGMALDMTVAVHKVEGKVLAGGLAVAPAAAEEVEAGRVGVAAERLWEALTAAACRVAWSVGRGGVEVPVGWEAPWEGFRGQAA